jgi:hypothetical protein
VGVPLTRASPGCNQRFAGTHQKGSPPPKLPNRGQRLRSLFCDSTIDLQCAVQLVELNIPFDQESAPNRRPRAKQGHFDGINVHKESSSIGVGTGSGNLPEIIVRN